MDKKEVRDYNLSVENFRNIVLVTLFACVFLFVGILIDRQILNRNQTVVQQALGTITHYFDGSIDESSLIQSLATNLDPYSYYLSPSDYKEILKQETGSQEGIGIIYLKKDNEVLVLSVLPHSPAEANGMVKGTLITQVNNIRVSDLSRDELILQLKGDEHNQVTLTTVVNGVEKTTTLTRTSLTESLSVKDLSEQTAYVKIYQFWPTTGEEFLKLVPSLSSKKNIIIDLRDNLGGTTEAALTISRAFINDGVLLIETLTPNEELITRAENNAALVSQKVIILVNRETSSAAEQMAAAFQANKRGIIMGEHTYGKSSIGNYFELKDGSALHLTTGHWLTPRKESVHEKGITPDVVVPNENTTQDTLLEYASKSL